MKTSATNLSWPVLVLALAVFFPSCVLNLVDYPGLTVPRNAFHETLSLEPGGTVQIENTEGDIEIRGWVRAAVEITAEAEYSPSSRPGFYASAWNLPRPRIQVDRLEDFIKIKSPTIGKGESPAAIHYILNVPKSVNLKDIRNKLGDITIADVFGKIAVDLGEGSLRIENFSGSLDASVDLGGVEADLLDLREEDEIRIVVHRGDITIYLQPDADARLEASAPEGTVDSEFDLGQAMPVNKVSGVIRTGKIPIILSALSGNIAVKKGD